MRSHFSDEKPLRLAAKIAITGALVVVPMAVVAAPAAADPPPGVVQVDRGWNDNFRDNRYDRDCYTRDWDRRGCNDWDRNGWDRNDWDRRQGPGYNMFNGFFPGLAPGGGLFGSS